MAEQVCSWCRLPIEQGFTKWFSVNGDNCPERTSQFGPLPHEPAEPSPEPEAAPQPENNSASVSQRCPERIWPGGQWAETHCDRERAHSGAHRDFTGKIEWSEIAEPQQAALAERQAPPLEPPGPKSPPLVCRKCGGSFYDPVFGGSCKCPKPVAEPQQASAAPDGWDHIIRYKDYADLQAQSAALKQQLKDEALAFNHANDLVAALEKDNDALKQSLGQCVEALDECGHYGVNKTLSRIRAAIAAAVKLLEQPMSDLRERATKDVAEAMGRSPGRLAYAIKNGGLGVKAKELAYAVSRQERVLQLEEKLARIAQHMNADDENSYRADDPEGAMDTVYSIASEGK